MGATRFLRGFSKTEADEEFFGRLDRSLPGVVFADRISLGVGKAPEALFIGVSFNRVSEALFSGTFFSFTAILC